MTLRVGLLFDRLVCDEAALAAQLAPYEVHDFRDFRNRRDQVTGLCRSVDVLITGKHTPTLARELAADPGHLRYICHTRGVLKAYFPRVLLEAGIRLSNWGASATGVAEHALALLLAQLHQVPQTDALVKGGADHRLAQAFPRTYRDFRIGVYGCGHIGRHFVALCQGLGMAVAVFDPWVVETPLGVERVDSLDALFARSWAVSIHCGLSDETRGSVGRAQLAALPQGGILINTARGPVVREAELAQLVGAGRIACALDVIEDEGDWAASPVAPFAQALLTGHGRFGRVIAQVEIDESRPGWRLPGYAERNLRAFAAGGALEHEITAEVYDRTT